MPSLAMDSNLVQLPVILVKVTTDKDGLDKARILLKFHPLDSQLKDSLPQHPHNLNRFKDPWTQ